jgi:hypothetical protein
MTDPTALIAWRKEQERRDRESWERRPVLRLPLPLPETVPERGESERGVAEITFTL